MEVVHHSLSVSLSVSVTYLAARQSHTAEGLLDLVRAGSLSPQHGGSSGCGWRNGLQLWGLAANILNKQLRTNDKGWSSSLGVGRGVNNPSP
jgi:hypothetical protein